MSYSLTHALHRAGRIKQIIEREVVSHQANAVRLMRLNALLLKAQSRLALLMQPRRLQPAMATARRGR